MNRYQITGTVIEKNETKVFSPFFRKREFKIRFADTDFTGKMIDRVWKVGLINENCELLDVVNVDAVVDCKFYIEGKDFTKDGKTLNFVNITVYELQVISDPKTKTEEDRNAVITKDGLVYAEKEASIEELIRGGAFNTKENEHLDNQPFGKEKPNAPVIDDNLPF